MLKQTKAFIWNKKNPIYSRIDIISEEEKEDKYNKMIREKGVVAF